MNKIKIFTVAAAMFMVNVAFSQSAEDIAKKFNEAAALVNQKKMVEAIPLLEDLVKITDVAGSEETVKKAKGLLPQLYLIQGKQAAAQGEFEKALEFFQKTAETGELFGDMKFMRQGQTMVSQVYLAQGSKEFNGKNYAKALELFSKGYQSADKNAKLALLRARCFDALDSLDQSIEAYREVIALEKVHDKFKGDADEAKELLTKSMLKNAIEAGNKSKFAEVEKYVDEAVSVGLPNYVPQALLLKLQMANNCQKYQEITTFGQQVVDAQTAADKKAEANFLIASAYLNLKNSEKALEYYKKVTAGQYAEMAKKTIEEINKAVESAK